MTFLNTFAVSSLKSGEKIFSDSNYLDYIFYYRGMILQNMSHAIDKICHTNIYPPSMFWHNIKLLPI